MLTAERINALKMMAEKRSCTIVTTFDGLMNPMPSPDQFISAVRKVAVGDVIDLEQFTRHLAELGYEKNYQVQTSGEFSVRGGIIDIFPLTEENPFRIELWDDEVDSIRSFDAESQRSIENLDEVHIYPACELVLTKEERDAGIARILAEAKQVSEKAPRGDEDRGGVPRQVCGGPGGGGSRGAGALCRAGRLPVLFLRGTSLFARLFWKTGYAGVSG